MKARLFTPSRAGRIMDGRVVAAAAVLVALLAGGAIAATSDTAQGLPGLVRTSHHCEPVEMKVLVDQSAARRTADGTYVPVDLINQWHEECELRGYVSVTGVAATAGHDAHAVHIPGVVTSVVLGQDYAAHIWVLIANAPGGAASGCRQLTATGLRINLPLYTGHDWVPYPFTACAGSGQAILSIRPVLQGLANPATFP
jgi:Domain of unknown function (DUF4232)